MRFEVTLSKAYADPSARSGQRYETVSVFEIEAADSVDATDQASQVASETDTYYQVRELSE